MEFRVLLIVKIMCRNDEFCLTMSWVGCLLKDSELFILFAENSQILLEISVIPILLTFIYLVALKSSIWFWALVSPPVLVLS